MRITNLHLIVSFLVLSGVGFFWYQFFGPRVPLSLPSFRMSVDETPPLPARAVPSVEEQKQRRLEAARVEAREALDQAWAALEAARRDGKDIVSAAQGYEKARQRFEEARLAEDHEAAALLARQARREAEEAPLLRLGVYVVGRGDNLWSIAKKTEVYGRGAGWVKIWRANEKKIPDFDRIYAGTKLTIPAD